MAKEQLQKFENLLELYKNILPQFIDKTDKLSSTHFTRNRKFTIEILVFCLIYLISDQNRFGYKHTMLNIWQRFRNAGLVRQNDFGPSASAFCRARKKLPAKIVKDIFYEIIEFVNTNQVQPSWKNHRLFAIDGTRVQLPYSKELKEYFKSPKNQKVESHYPQAILSKLYCVLTDVVHDFELAPYDASEREIAISHLNHLKPDDIVIADRGYPSYRFFWEHISRKIHFIIRVPLSRWSVVQKFVRSGKLEQIVIFKMDKQLKRTLKDDLSIPEELKLRLIRVTLNTGETEVLVTSLLDTEKYLYENFQFLYHWRWSIEEANRSAKHHQCIENFHAQYKNGILQEINAHYLLMAMTRLFMLQAQAKTPEFLYFGLSYKAAVNFVSVQLVSILFVKNELNFKSTVNEISNMIIQMYEKPRPERTNIRQVRARKVCHFPLAQEKKT